MKDPLLSALPPDDSGSDTFARYRYQAHVAVPFCVLCGLGEAVDSILLEHFEDIVIDEPRGWRFIQVKTRDPERGPWRLSHILRGGGGVDSLARTYSHLPNKSGKFELRLEGSLAREDIRTFAPPKGEVSAEVRGRFAAADAIDLPSDDLDGFLSKLFVSKQAPSESIISQNLIALGNRAEEISLSTIKSVYERILELVETAMARERLGEDLYDVIRPSAELSDDARRLAEAKRLTRSELTPICEQLDERQAPLLRRQVDVNVPKPSKLQLKLIQGGATAGLLEEAKALRLNAYAQQAKLRSSQIYDSEAKLEDVARRLTTLAASVVSAHSTDDYPARRAWDRVRGELMNHPDQYDPWSVFDQDPFLLLGYLCQLTDDCRSDWGRISA